MTEQSGPRSERAVKYGVCNFCDSMCGLEFEVAGREILSVRGDKLDPFSRGHICPKGTVQKDLYADPDRLRKPIRRSGGSWQSTSWESAYAELADRVVAIQKRHGADALGVYYGNPISHSYQGMLALLGFLKMLGTKNAYSSNSVDALPRMLVSKLLYGNQALLPVPDIDRTDLFVVMGANPVVSNGSVMSAPDVKGRLRRIQQRGGRVVVIDPRRTETAALSDQHIFIRPGADVWFLLAVLNVVFRHELKQHVPVMHLDVLRGIVAEFPPERVADACGVSASTITGLASEFARAPSAAWYGRMGTSTQRFGVTSTWLIDAVNIVTGHFDRPGGAMFATPAVDLAAVAKSLGETGKFDRWRSRVTGQPEFNGEFPVGSLADAIQTPGKGRLLGLLTVAGNPVLSNPNGRRLDAAFAELPFMASVDFYLNETTRHARLILPPTTPVEGDHYPMLEAAMAVRNVARYSPAVIPRSDGARHDWEILLESVRAVSEKRGGVHRASGWLARALGRGLKSGWILDTLMRLGPQNLRLRDLKEQAHGVDLGPLESRGKGVLNTRGGKIDLAPDLVVNDMGRVAQVLSASVRGAPTLLLIGRRTLRSMNSWLHNSHAMVKGPNRCTLMIHPDDASHRDIQQGSRVRLKSRVGEIFLPALITDEMMPGAVCMPYGWGHDRAGAKLSVASQHAGASMNDVVDERLFDEVGGTAVLDGVPVQVSAAPA